MVHISPASDLSPLARKRVGIAIVLGALVIFGIVIAYHTFDPTRIALTDALSSFNDNDLKAAEKAADSVLAKDPHNMQALLAKATALGQEGSLSFKEEEFGTQSMALAQQVIAIDPKNSEAWRLVGYAYEIMQKYDDAHAAYARAIAFDPKNVAAISQDAHAYDLEGKRDLAEAGYKRALAIDPLFDQARFGLGRIEAAQGNLDGALKLFTAVAQHAQNARMRAEAAYSAGVLENSKGDLVAGERFMTQATAADQTYALGWSGLATNIFLDALAPTNKQSFAARNDTISRSLDMLQKAIALNPNQTQAYIQLATELITVGKTKEGIQILQGALTIVPHDITLSAADKKTTLTIISGLIANAEKTK